MFYKHSGDEYTIVAVVTDDMAVTSKWKTDADQFKSDIKKHWEIWTYQCKAHSYSNGQTIQFMTEQSPSTPNQSSWMRGITYSKAIGSVLWPVVVSRLDAAYAVGVLLQFIQNPGTVFWEGVKRVIVYLGATKDKWLTFGRCTKGIVMWIGVDISIDT